MRHLSIESTDVWRKIIDMDNHFFGDSDDDFNKLFLNAMQRALTPSMRVPVDLWNKSLTMAWEPSTLEVEPTPRWQWWLVKACK
ncbi:hypothetical protein O181_107644 [Austropuccinia psidii MF-1]|uniref:Uncharacterized protein n=1 Tax=Austropuccinia psidii MF-1 TaxID=1389203 RepID=A0A9Q3JTG9_9BASI|nr:hypothetical protein [Austropuccinia psidii MF-1]